MLQYRRQCYNVINLHCTLIIIITGSANSINLEKVEFGKIINGTLVYNGEESDSTVFKGLVAVCSYKLAMNYN